MEFNFCEINAQQLVYQFDYIICTVHLDFELFHLLHLQKKQFEIGGAVAYNHRLAWFVVGNLQGFISEIFSGGGHVYRHVTLLITIL